MIGGTKINKEVFIILLGKINAVPAAFFPHFYIGAVFCYISITMSNPNIKFGTSGWRAVIAEDFNTINVKRVSHAIAEHIRENKDPMFRRVFYIYISFQ